jgi:FkbM family methyltransferase
MQNVYSKIAFGNSIQFTMACGSEANDDLSRTLAAGNYPWGPESALMDCLFQPEAKILDLGAHLGMVSLFAAAKGCQVLAVEASPRNAELLQESASCNGFARMRVIHAAVSDHPGVLEFCPQGPHGFVATPQINSPGIKVRALTVDQILQEAGWDHVDFIKMDIEGSELAAIEGMQGLLKKDHPPPILYESNTYTLSFYKKTANQLKAAVEMFGYKNHTVDTPGLVCVAAQDFQPQVVTDYFAFKHKPSELCDWKILPAVSKKVIIQKIVKALTDKDQKAHMARDLQFAPSWLLARKEVIAQLAALRNDLQPHVREAASWSHPSPSISPLRGKIARWWNRSA